MKNKLSFQWWRGWVKRRDTAPRGRSPENRRQPTIGDGHAEPRASEARMRAKIELERDAGIYWVRAKLLRQMQFQRADAGGDIEPHLTLYRQRLQRDRMVRPAD